MTKRSQIEVLNRLLAAHEYSLPRYLTYAHPWTRSGDQQAVETLRHIVADQQELSERIANMIGELGGITQPGLFPMRYTDLHDLDVEFLLRCLIDAQRQMIATLERCAADLGTAAMPRALAEEALGSARGHLESLEELARQPVAAA